MKTKAEKLTHDVYYKILECCISDNPPTRADIAKILNISEQWYPLIDKAMIDEFNKVLQPEIEFHYLQIQDSTIEQIW